MTAMPQINSVQQTEEKVVLIDPSRVRPFKNQPRKRFRAIQALATSIKAVGQKVPVLVKEITGDDEHDYELCDGERRLRACLLLGKKEIKAIVQDPNENLDQFEISVVSNFGREGHDCIEIAHAIKKFKARGKNLEEITALFGKSTTWVSQHMSLLRLHEDVQEMLVVDDEEELDKVELSPGEKAVRKTSILRLRKSRKSMLPMSIALLLVNLPQDLQIQAANKIIAENYSLVKARRYVLQILRDTGVKTVSQKKCNQKERFSSLVSLVDHARDQVGIYLDMKSSEFDKMFSGKPTIIKESTIEAIRGLLEDLNGLINAIDPQK